MNIFIIDYYVYDDNNDHRRSIATNDDTTRDNASRYATTTSNLKSITGTSTPLDTSRMTMMMTTVAPDDDTGVTRDSR